MNSNVTPPLSFDEWKRGKDFGMPLHMREAMKRLHGTDPSEDHENMLKNEYIEYLNNYNGAWLLKG